MTARRPRTHRCKCPCLAHRDQIHPGAASQCPMCIPVIRKHPDAYTRLHPPAHPAMIMVAP